MQIPIRGKWINKLLYILKIEHYLVTKNLFIYASIRMNLTYILNEKRNPDLKRYILYHFIYSEDLEQSKLIYDEKN